MKILNSKILNDLLLLIIVACLTGCKKYTEPLLSTTAVSSITQTTATSGGNVTGDGGATILSRGICWSTNNTPTVTDNKTLDSTGTGNFVSAITGLTAGKAYNVRAYATNSIGTGYGNLVTFTSLRVEVPALTTTAIISITQTTAVSGGNITLDNGGSVSARGVCWSISANPTIESGKTIENGGLGAFTSNITQLLPNTLYYVRAYATNSAGTGYGNQVSFITSPTIPTLTTLTVSSISATSSNTGGNIGSDGGASITVRGVCWSTTQNPTIANSITSDGSGIGSFTSSLSGLIAGTTYYVKAYATNNVGTGYGNAITFTTQSPIVFNPNLTYGTVTDIEGNVYKTKAIGTQTWMAENVKTTHFNNTNMIPIQNVTSSQTWTYSHPAAYCWYNNDIANKDTYGALYNWYAVASGNLCPTGWHVPTYDEWTTLMNYLGGWGVVDGKLKESGTGHWKSPNINANNSSGFTALPGGKRDYTGWFGDIGYSAYFWTNTKLGAPGINEDSRAYRFELRNDDDFGSSTTYRNWFDEKLSFGYSVRCVKD